MDEVPRQDSLARAVKWLAFAVGALALVLLGMLAVWSYTFYQSLSSFRGASAVRSAGPDASASRRRGDPRMDGRGFDSLSPEQKVERAAAILLTKHEKSDGRNKSIVVEVLKQVPGVAPPRAVGEEISELSRYEMGDDGGHGEGDVVFYKDSSFESWYSMTYRNGRIPGMGDMPLDVIRALASGKRPAAPSPVAGSAPPPPRSAAVEPDADAIQLERSTNGQGTTRSFAISKRTALRIPEWRPEDGVLPLTPEKAARVATAAAQAESPGHPTTVARGIRIQLVSCDEPIGNRWYYVIDCVPIRNGTPAMIASLPVVVLMDGTVVPGKVQS